MTESVYADLHSELATLSKLLYKNRNQHRRTPYFRLLERVRREYAALGPLRVQRIRDAEKMVKTLDIGRDGAPRSTTEHSSSEQLAVLDNTASTTLGFMHVSKSVVACSARVASLLGQGFFMPFALVMTAVLARLRTLTQKITAILLKITQQLQLLILREACRGQPSIGAVEALTKRCSPFLSLGLERPKFVEHGSMCKLTRGIDADATVGPDAPDKQRGVAPDWLRRREQRG
jgi:hypothetical protein